MNIVGRTSAEIFDCIRGLEQTGDLMPGQSLPTVRELASSLGVNRNTVSLAYKRLADAGIALTQGRRGTVIREHHGPGEQEGLVPGSPLVDLGSGNPDPDWLPDIGEVLARGPRRPRLYGQPPVDPELEAVARPWLAHDCLQRFEIDLTHGSVDAVERLLSAHLVAGDKVAVEDPCFVSSINMLRVAGLQPIGMAVDDEGLRAESLEDALARGAQAVIVTPRAHNPTGSSLSHARARALRAVLARHPRTLVIIDDHFSLLAKAGYHDVVPPGAHRWALVRSVSKMLGPDLRLAFVASDPKTSRRLRLRLASGTNWVSHLLQEIVMACLTSPRVGERIAQARRSYARRRQIMAAALSGQGIEPSAPADGLNLWLPLRAASAPAVLALARHGWLVRGGEAFGLRRPAHGLRITVATIDEVRARAFANDLRIVLGEVGERIG